LGNQGHQIVVKLWFTIAKCFHAQSAERYSHAYDRRRSSLSLLHHVAL
jgi:hypothetical protein